MTGGSGGGGLDTTGLLGKRINNDGYRWWAVRLWPFHRWLVFTGEHRKSEPFDYRETGRKPLELPPMAHPPYSFHRPLLEGLGWCCWRAIWPWHRCREK